MELFSYIERGGPVMYILLVLNILGMGIMLWKALLLSGAKKRSAGFLSELLDSIKHEGHLGLELAKKELEAHMREYESGLNTVKIIASIAPLLGLLGTVIGVLMAFDAIKVHGMGEAEMFAGGISVALLTTIGGLVVAIPHYIGYNYIIGMIDKIESRLEKELAAQMIESHRT